MEILETGILYVASKCPSDVNEVELMRMLKSKTANDRIVSKLLE